MSFPLIFSKTCCCAASGRSRPSALGRLRRHDGAGHQEELAAPPQGSVGSLVGLGMRERASPAVRAAIGSSLDLRTICALHKAQRAALQGHRGGKPPGAPYAFHCRSCLDLVLTALAAAAPVLLGQNGGAGHVCNDNSDDRPCPNAAPASVRRRPAPGRGANLRSRLAGCALVPAISRGRDGAASGATVAARQAPRSLTGAVPYWVPKLTCRLPAAVTADGPRHLRACQAVGRSCRSRRRPKACA